MLSKRGLAGGVAAAALVFALPVDDAAAQQQQDATEKAKNPLKGGASVKKPKRKPTKGEERFAKDTAKSGESQPHLSNNNGRLEGDIIVMGLRENVKSSRNAKRRASQIVDVVVV